MLKQHLADHSIQTPPYAIFLFTQSEIKAILEFAQQTFLRHYSLYEFAFKPRVDLILRSDPIINDKLNANLQSLDAMETVDNLEVERLKGFIGLGEYQTQTFVQQSQIESQKELDSIGHHSTLTSQKGVEPVVATATNAMDLREAG